VTLAATDRYRLAARQIAWKPEQPDLEAVALVPARTLADTAKSLSGGDVQLALSSSAHGEGLIGFEAGGRRTTSRLLEGEFPKYNSLFPNESSSVAHVDTAPFVEAVRRVSLVAERNTPVRFAFSEGQCVLEAGTGDEAQASESVEATVEGDDVSIAFNPTFLLDGLNATGADRATLSFTSSTRPAVITSADDTDLDYRYLIMPVRLSG
jgi:DNA polymerase III subunit beta